MGARSRSQLVSRLIKQPPKLAQTEPVKLPRPAPCTRVAEPGERVRASLFATTRGTPVLAARSSYCERPLAWPRARSTASGQTRRHLLIRRGLFALAEGLAGRWRRR